MAEDPLTTHARNRLGRVLRGKWTLDRIIGVGGMAAVYEATHRNGSKVAIKILHPTLMYDQNFAHRLIQEGYVANKLNHPAAVKVMDDDADETDGAVFLVMELLEGMTLSQARRKRKKFPAVEACRMIEPVLECLGNAHALGIIHRDIKPENLFLTKDNVVRVLDFGIARVSDSTNVSATRTGMVVGSPAYMAPEQALGKMNSVGPQTDVYAVGATLFALIAGATPHAGESTQEMIVMVATQSARPILSVAPDVPAPIARVIDRALAYDREKRYADARAMLEDMRAALAEVEGAAANVLPTFADDDDEGQTTVNNALPEKSAAAPLPAAGANRVGTRPATGRFQVGPPSAPPISAAPNPPPLASPPMRPPTLAPTGAPALGMAPIAPPQPQPPPVGASSGAHSAPGSTSAPGVQSAPFPAVVPAPQSSDASGSFNLNAPLTPGVPATMAMPMINPGDLASPPGSTSGQHPGVTSGQRPGATTNMAWAAPPEAPPPDVPAPRKPKTALFAVAAVAVLGLGVGGYFAFSGGNDRPPQPQVHAARPPARVDPPSTPPSPQTPPVAQNTPPPATADAEPDAAEPAAAADAAAVLAQNTPPAADPPAADPPAADPPAADPPAADPPEERSARTRSRSRDHGTQAEPRNRTRNRTRNRNSNPLGY